MATGLINKYIWIIDTISRYGRITREDLNGLWIKSSLSDGVAMPRRTFYNYRQGIQDTFNVAIECDPSTYEYYIDDAGNKQDASMRDWLLDSVSLSGLLSDSHDIAPRIMLEDVPSARAHLPVIVQAIKQNQRISITYKAFNRLNASDVLLSPYFVRIFKQRWYVIGENIKENAIKTYSLDRIKEVRIMPDKFIMPAYFDANEFFKDCFGIMTSKGDPKDVVLRVNSEQAKYFRALPLHHSQQEEVHDTYSNFHYKLLITYDFTQEILSHGAKIEVVSPPELRAIVISELTETLSLYKK